MSIFTRLREYLAPSRPHTTANSFSVPFSLTPEQWNALKSLPLREGWDEFLLALDALAKLNGERMLATSDERALHYLRGHVAGLRKAGALIREEMLRETQHAKTQETRNENARIRNDRSALFGTPGWRPQRKHDASGV